MQCMDRREGEREGGFAIAVTLPFPRSAAIPASLVSRRRRQLCLLCRSPPPLSCCHGAELRSLIGGGGSGGSHLGKEREKVSS